MTCEEYRAAVSRPSPPKTLDELEKEVERILNEPPDQEERDGMAHYQACAECRVWYDTLVARLEKLAAKRFGWKIVHH